MANEVSKISVVLSEFEGLDGKNTGCDYAVLNCQCKSCDFLQLHEKKTLYLLFTSIICPPIGLFNVFYIVYGLMVRDREPRSTENYAESSELNWGQGDTEEREVLLNHKYRRRAAWVRIGYSIAAVILSGIVCGCLTIGILWHPRLR